MVPFIAGLAVGGLAVFAFSNKKKLEEVAQKSYEKTKEVACDIKKSAKSTAECIKNKMNDEDKVVENVQVAPAKTTKTKNES